jgi:hypothetical protein
MLVRKFRAHCFHPLALKENVDPLEEMLFIDRAHVSPVKVTGPLRCGVQPADLAMGVDSLRLYLMALEWKTPDCV